MIARWAAEDENDYKVEEQAENPEPK